MRKNVLILGHDDTTQFVDIYNQYTRLFDNREFEVTVAYLLGEPTPAIQQRLIAEHVVFFNFPQKNIRQLKIGAIKTLLAFCKEKKFHIVICHRYKPTYTMMWVNQFYRFPVFISVMHELKTLSSLKRKLFIACLARKNIVFAGVSNAVRDDMRKELWGIPKERIITLYNVMDIEATQPQLLSRDAARAALHLHAEDFVFGNFARLVPNKDQASLIHAFSIIKPYCPHAKLIILGVGKLAESLQQQVNDASLQDQVIFYGQIPNAFSYMPALDGFVLSSVQEAFGRVLLEAMLAKIPVIATQAHGIPEVLGETNVLVNPKAPVELASAMKQLYDLSAQERQQRGEQGYKQVNNYFSIPVFYERFWEMPLLQNR